MKRMSVLGGALASLASVGLASAADAPAYEPSTEIVAPVPSFTWTGPYVGLQAGYGWLDADTRLNGREPDLKPDGFTAGGFAGYNHQFDGSPVVIGVEADINYSDADASRATRAFAGLEAAKLTNESAFNGSVRGRVGYAFDRFLVYGAGGLAYADHEISARGSSDDTVAVGWTIGGGVEAALTDNVTARVEYRYSDYGADTFSVAGERVKSDLTENRVLLGVGYKFSTGW